MGLLEMFTSSLDTDEAGGDPLPLPLISGEEYQYSQMPEHSITSQEGKISYITTIKQSSTKENIRTLRSASVRALSTVGKSAEVASLSVLLRVIVHQELANCNLLLVHDANDLYSAVVQDLMLFLPNPRQVVVMRKAEDLLGVLWVSTGCGGYLLLLDHPQPLLTFANTHHHTWDYHGRYVFVSQRVEQVEALVATRNGKKTEHILGVVKGGQEGEWRVYMNMLYWGEGVRPVTTWRHHRFTSQSQLFPDKLHDLQGAGLRISTFEYPPSNMYYRADNGSLLFRYGEDIALTDTLAYVLNFTPRYAEPADGNKWGRQVNGTWQGMMGEITRDEVDIGLANLYIRINRAHILEFSAPFSDDGSCFMARVEPPLPRWQALAFPFHPWTWLAILVGLILSGPILFLLVRATTRWDSVDEVKRLTELGYSWNFAFGLHFREPQDVNPRMDSTRVFVLFLWLYTMILTIVYSSNLTAFLLVQKPPTSIQTLDDLYESGLEVAGFGALITDTSEYINKMYRRFKTLDDAFGLVMEGKAVFWASRGFLRYHIVTGLTTRGVSRARIMKECFLPYSIAMGLQQHSPLKRKFDEVIGWIQQSGILRQDVTQALRLAATTKEYGAGFGGEVLSEESEGTRGALNLDHMQGVFMVAAIGWFIAIHVALIEIFVLRG
ncbi:hypothetical protein Pcinc_020903 [Petrolisthes cinctipes]|uniref:Uncharacterized protein n=1 Tax=Petrolisthes cinctipes TaxID=88211 RepID=A0AAE1FLI3_PETCI|nr:hypothetical protein Pcinc_020903 [Petrolisthes cinctipes]